MTRPATAPRIPQPRPDALTVRIFRALYRDYDLHTIGHVYVAVPKDTPCFTAHSLSDIVQQISHHEHPDPEPRPDVASPASCIPLPQRPVARPPATSLPHPGDAERITSFLREHPSWSAFWDKQDRVWRVAEDDPDSCLYAVSADLETLRSYVTEHS